MRSFSLQRHSAAKQICITFLVGNECAVFGMKIMTICVNQYRYLYLNNSQAPQIGYSRPKFPSI